MPRTTRTSRFEAKTWHSISTLTMQRLIKHTVKICYIVLKEMKKSFPRALTYSVVMSVCSWRDKDLLFILVISILHISELDI